MIPHLIQSIKHMHLKPPIKMLKAFTVFSLFITLFIQSWKLEIHKL